jgi:hypothetical protein
MLMRATDEENYLEKRQHDNLSSGDAEIIQVVVSSLVSKKVRPTYQSILAELERAYGTMRAASK